MPKIKVGDIEMYYELHGKGTPLVHIGGLAGDARAWQKNIEHYAKNHQVLAFDNRGTGRSGCPDMPYSTKLFAEDTLGLMDALDLPAAHVLGISMGGAIAQWMALMRPDRVKSLIINASFARMDRFGARTLENTMEVAKALGHREAAKHFALYFFTPPYFNENPAEIDKKEEVLGQSDRPMHAFVNSTIACLEHDTRDKLKEIACPALVMAGAEDLMCSAACSEEIAEGIPDARLKIFPDASHFFLVQYFDEAMKEIDSFLAEVDGK